ncbi:PREDICTED: CMRF35-like molecule 3, partial [Nanorana parkeri]|uniref:CMRF35-like molecule 3 n=1 Tax=Nanorana parkeri TaxID=125878 RepID=UPI0008545BE8
GAENIRGPSEVTIQYGGSLSVTCEYNDGFQSYVKYWCKGESWKSCASIIKSGDGSHHRYSIQDYPGERKFTITGREMRPEDSDTYYWGMERAFSDDMHAVRVTVLP